MLTHGRSAALADLPLDSKWPSGLQAAVDRIHARGLKVGIHTLSANIQWDDPYVTPVPDPGLAKLGALTLLHDLGDAASEVPFVAVLENTSGLPTPYGPLISDVGYSRLGLDFDHFSCTTPGNARHLAPPRLPCLSYADWGLHSDGAPVLPLQAGLPD